MNGGILEVFENSCTLLTEDIYDLESKVISNDDKLSQKKAEIASQQFYN